MSTVTTIPFQSCSLVFPDWFEKLWMIQRPTSVSPSAEAEDAKKICDRLIFRSAWTLLPGIAGFLCSLWILTIYGISSAYFIFLVGGMALLSFIAIMWGVYYSTRLSMVKTPLNDAFTKELRELYLELNQKFDLDVWTFGEKYKTPEDLRADIGTWLTKAAKQIDAKHKAGFLLDAELERGRFNELYAAAWKFGLVDPVRRNYYPPDSRV